MPKGVYKRVIPPWNKGIPRTIEEKRKMSATKKGMYEGSKNPNWNGGKTKISGRIFIYCPNHPHAVENRVQRSRLIMEKHLGRYLKSEERVHHINQVTTDDRLKNLRLFKNTGEHLAHHAKYRNFAKNGDFLPGHTKSSF